MTKFKYCPKCGSELEIKAVRSHNRLVCKKCGFVFFQNPKPAVGVFIVEHQKVLLAKRAIEPFKEYWDSIGGFMEEGESPQETAVREAKEETGLDVEIVSILGAGKDVYAGQDIVPIATLGRIKSGEMKAQDDVSELKWFPLRDLPGNIAFDSNKKALDLIKKKFLE